MYRNVKKHNNDFGFSLLELAIVFVVAGLIIAPAISIYHNYRVDKDWTETEKNIDEAVNEIGGFRAVYSKYPCPASLTAQPGNLNYGLEDCTVNALGTCVGGICTYASNISGRVVVVGALPFKTINLQESESYDKSLNRLTYAVTRDLTDSATFDVSLGAIGIIDKTGATIIDPIDTAHFAVISHGQNKIGGFTRAGVQGYSCAVGSTSEQENCDADSVFLSGDVDSNFDDRIEFFSRVKPSQWQISANDNDEIHLKNANNFAIGAAMGDYLGDADEGHVRAAPYSGSIRSSGNFYVDALCEDDATAAIDCFAPRLIAGFLVDTGHPEGRLTAEASGGSGMSCYTPSDGHDYYLVGIENGGPICAEEIYISCPNGSFITAIDGDGNVKCNSAPDPGCDDQNIITTCGDTRTLENTYSGGIRKVYSGECRMITNYDEDYFREEFEGLSLEQMKDRVSYINGNDSDRSIEACESSASNSLVRDNYMCTSGTWNHVSAQENRHGNGYPSDIYYDFWWFAETGYMGEDVLHDNQYHDCWCREDYRLVEIACPANMAGTGILIQKHNCPQTIHSWHNVLDDPIEELCACAPGTEIETQSCNSYYDEINDTSGTSGLDGDVIFTYDITCVNGEAVKSDDPIVDASGCGCSDDDPYIERDNCPTGKTNSWSWDLGWASGDEIGVELLSTSAWICPSTTSGGLPDPGYLEEDLTPYSPIPACTCDTELTDIVIKPCPTSLEGSGIEYEMEWDCEANNWEDEADWEEIGDDCKACAWQAPTGAAMTKDYAFGVEVGGSCNCTTETTTLYCWDDGSPYDVWTNCGCIVQED